MKCSHVISQAQTKDHSLRGKDAAGDDLSIMRPARLNSRVRGCQKTPNRNVLRKVFSGAVKHVAKPTTNMFHALRDCPRNSVDMLRNSVDLLLNIAYMECLTSVQKQMLVLHISSLLLVINRTATRSYGVSSLLSSALRKEVLSAHFGFCANIFSQLTTSRRRHR